MTDIHQQTAAMIFGVPEAKVTPEMRARAKVINHFSIISGRPLRQCVFETPPENEGERPEPCVLYGDYIVRNSLNKVYVPVCKRHLKVISSQVPQEVRQVFTLAEWLARGGDS